MCGYENKCLDFCQRLWWFSKAVIVGDPSRFTTSVVLSSWFSFHYQSWSSVFVWILSKLLVAAKVCVTLQYPQSFCAMQSLVWFIDTIDWQLCCLLVSFGSFCGTFCYHESQFSGRIQSAQSPLRTLHLLGNMVSSASSGDEEGKQQ